MKLLILALVVCLSSYSSDNSSDEYSEKYLKDFSSDGCSLSMDGTLMDPDKWRYCCVKHDIAYWAGGTEAQRIQADKEFKQCVGDTYSRYLAKIMYIAVRVGGDSVYPTTYRWGYGWSYDRKKVPHTEDELEQIEQLKPKSVDDVAIETNYLVWDLAIFKEKFKGLFSKNSSSVNN